MIDADHSCTISCSEMFNVFNLSTVQKGENLILNFCRRQASRNRFELLAFCLFGACGHCEAHSCRMRFCVGTGNRHKRNICRKPHLSEESRLCLPSPQPPKGLSHPGLVWLRAQKKAGPVRLRNFLSPLCGQPCCLRLLRPGFEKSQTQTKVIKVQPEGASMRKPFVKKLKEKPNLRRNLYFGLFGFEGLDGLALRISSLKNLV